MNCKTFAVGGVLFVIENRGDGEDDGASLSLLVEVTPHPGESPRLMTVWRVDCIMRDPHQHFFHPEEEIIQHPEWFARSPEPIKGVTKSEPATFDGTLELFMERLLHVSDTIEEAGYLPSAEVDQAAINAATGEIQRWMTLAQDPETFAEAL